MVLSEAGAPPGGLGKMPILIQKFWGGHGVPHFLQVPGDAVPLVFEFPLLAKV